jgi:hypothetical protein
LYWSSRFIKNGQDLTLIVGKRKKRVKFLFNLIAVYILYLYTWCESVHVLIFPKIMDDSTPV